MIGTLIYLNGTVEDTLKLSGDDVCEGMYRVIKSIALPKDIETDIAIVSGWGTGLAAAVAAAEYVLKK
jgi:hypothetical protein